MATVEIAFKPQSDILEQFWESNKRLQFIMGPVGSAKTSHTIWKLFKLACEQAPNAEGVRPTRWRVLRNTLTDLKANTLADWQAAIEPDLFGKYTNSPPPTHGIRIELGDGTTVEADFMFLGLDTEAHIRRIRGGNWTGAWCNELTEMHPSVLRMIRSRIGRYPTVASGGVECSIGQDVYNESLDKWEKSGVILADYNAPDQDHWLYKLVEEDRPEDLDFFRQPGGVQKKKNVWVPNPKADNLHNLPGGINYYTSQLAGNPSDWINVNLANEYGLVSDGKPVFADYSDSAHCLEFDADPALPLLLGWDAGLTPACIVGQLSKRGQLRIINEFCAEDMGMRRFARDVVKPGLAKYRGYTIGLSWGDPSNTRGDADEKRAIGILNDDYVDNDDGDDIVALDMGFMTEPANTNFITPRLEAVRFYLTMMLDGAPGFIIHPRCKILRQALSGKYRFRRLKVVGEEKFTDTPEKNDWSHPADALQYLCLGAQGGYVGEAEGWAPEPTNDTRDVHTGY